MPASHVTPVRRAGLAAAMFAALAAVTRVRRVVVAGNSMLPTLEPGDRLLVVRGRRFSPGDLVAVPDPRDPSRLLVKRVASRHGGSVVLVGDAPQASTDSRTFGPVPESTVIGRVVRRYAPAARAGRLR